ncbi:MAG: proteasome-activating nucleotidase [Theionarchaea archaeon]|nr:proteasome-activating nucleotidase [Theionarchaea archaeon]MBU7001832.1 proteasome-activating nucleotidase [Theionarchaea archaeon]MBU7020935.1 proteasome-activating nucleotidase [Theionarchaea archaeon]MBU7033989.1 proteasome-activating nucleotidase [Theionarchaea archaeon]MBU7040986.1 proteasome-activating nucleotidase [Theionarchaea archaeon]
MSYQAKYDEGGRREADRVDAESYLQNLQRRIKSLELQKRNTETELVRLQRENRELRKELDRLRSPPLITAVVEDVLVDGRAVVKSSSGPNYVVNVSHFVNTNDIVVGSRVAMNQRTLSILEVLPFSRDQAVSSMEIVKRPAVSYKDIGGLDLQIAEIKETVELPLKHPELFERVGIEPPSGVLLYGPPGNGKTQLAKAVASETESTFIKVVGSEFVRKFIGEGARIVREVFQLAREKGPSIVFIDEIDAIGSRRIDSEVSGDREVHRTMMQLLSEMDGFDPSGNVKILAATNRPDILDPALLRPGRFDRLIEVPLPDKKGRVNVLTIHTRNMNLKNVELEDVAERSENASGADLKAICTEAGMFAIRESRDYIEEADFFSACNKVLGSYEEKDSESGLIYG